MKIVIGSAKQIIIALILLGVIGVATVSPHLSNIHLAITIFLGVLHLYLGYQISEKKVKPKSDSPASYAYICAFGVNAIISFAFSWWFSGIVWVYILCIYIAANNKKIDSIY
jgi:uncharacterized membrane protein YfcA